ncbi:MAG: ADOP family duplicated permease [Longimicrobiales bacterium]
MRHVRRVFARIAGFFGGQRTDDDLRAELESHLEMEIAENIRRGMQPNEARRQALLASGGLDQAAESVRDQRGLPVLEGLVGDVRYSLRALRHARGFTAVVVLTLALGIGANTAIFSVIRGVLLEPLPHRGGDSLVYLRHMMDGVGGEDLNFSVPEVRDLRDGVPSLAGIAEYSSWDVIHQEDEGALRLQVGLVTGNYFEVMGLAPILGRLTLPSDDGPGAAPVAVLTYESWMQRFGGDAGIVGEEVRLDNRAVKVIGVVEPAPFFPHRVDALLNMVNSEHHLSASMLEERPHRMTRVVARLAQGATVDQARAEVATVYARMHSEHPEAYDAVSHYRVDVIPFREALGERARLTMWLLMGAAALVLIIAVANVANLTLMRGLRREHELVMRAALGAGTLRLRRLLLVENLLLAFVGAAFGALIAVGGVELLTSFAERYSPRASEIDLDAVVLGFTVALSALVALLLSLLGWTPVERRLAGWIAAAERRVSGSVRKQRLQRGLVVVQVAVAVMLLAGAGLLTRTLMRLSDVDIGVSTEHVITMQVTLLSIDQARVTDSPEAVAARRRFEEMRDEIASLPGVVEVGVGSTLPLRRSIVVFEVMAEGKPLAAGEAWPRVEVRTADPNYFSAAGIPLVGGRKFATTDELNAGEVVIINKTLADMFFPDEDPTGKRIALLAYWTGEQNPSTADWRMVVGVVGNTRDGGLEAEPQPVAFLPVSQLPIFSMGGGLVIRAGSDASVSAVTAAASRTARRIAPTALIEEVMTIQQFKNGRLSPRRLNAVLISSFGLLALIIAAVGIGGVLAFSVTARTNEIGIRMSLGADRAAVGQMILREGGSLVAIGLVLGVTGALFAGRVIRGLLFGIAPNDPVTLASAGLIMAAIGIVACWTPALRAARIDPAITMRAQ